MRRCAVLTLPAAVLATALAGCGDVTTPESSPSSSSEGQPAAEWRRHALSGTPAVDFSPVVAADDAGILVALLSDEGVLQTDLSTDGRGFVAGTPLDTGRTYVALGGAAAHAGGWYALGSGGLEQVEGGDEDGELVHEAVGFVSDDGLSWSRVEVTGFDGPVDVEDLVEIDGTLVAAGSYRTAPDPSVGGFRRSVWTSSDGVTWTEAVLLAARGESYVGDLAVSGERLLAAGRVGRTAALIASDDGGRSWYDVDVPALADRYTLTAIASLGDVVVATADGEGGPTVLRSTDQGRTWAPASVPPPDGDEDLGAPLTSGGGRFLTTTHVFRDAFGEPEVCYATIELCQQDTAVSLYASEDGDTWRRVDTSGIGRGEDGEVDLAVGFGDGGVVALQSSLARAEVSVWPAGPPLPTEQEPTVTRTELVTVPETGPEPGVRYHAPLYIHCGMDVLYLGDQPWRRTDPGPDVETGAGDMPPPDWPIAQQTIFGYATLVDDGVVEYSLEDGTVIATYEPSRAVAGCD